MVMKLPWVNDSQLFGWNILQVDRRLGPFGRAEGQPHALVGGLEVEVEVVGDRSTVNGDQFVFRMNLPEQRRGGIDS